MESSHTSHGYGYDLDEDLNLLSLIEEELSNDPGEIHSQDRDKADGCHTSEQYMFQCYDETSWQSGDSSGFPSGDSSGSPSGHSSGFPSEHSSDFPSRDSSGFPSGHSPGGEYPGETRCSNEANCLLGDQLCQGNEQINDDGLFEQSTPLFDVQRQYPTRYSHQLCKVRNIHSHEDNHDNMIHQGLAIHARPNYQQIWSPDKLMSPDSSQPIRSPDTRASPESSQPIRSPDTRAFPDSSQPIRSPDIRSSPDSSQPIRSPDTRASPDRLPPGVSSHDGCTCCTLSQQIMVPFFSCFGVVFAPANKNLTRPGQD